MSPTPTTEVKPTIDSDAVARAATQRAERLEKQVDELKKKLEERPKAPKDAVVDGLKAELERMKDQYNGLLDKLEAAAEVAGKLKREPAPLEEKFKGTKNYRSTQPHYRGGRFYNPGEVITVTDERPSKHWVLVEKRAVVTEFVDVEQPAEVPPASTPEV